MNTKNSKTNESNRFRLFVTDFRGNKTIVLTNLSRQYTEQNVKSEYKNNKFKMTATTWDETLDLSDRSYSIADIQGYFEFIIKKHETISTDKNSPILIIQTKYKKE